MTLRSILLAAASAVTLSGCLTASEPPQSELSLAESAPLVSADGSRFVEAEPVELWWKLYESEALDTLVRTALERNRTLAEVSAELEQVRASLGEARSARLPSTTTSAEAGYARQPVEPSGYVEGDRYSVGFDTRWQLDLFGRVRNAVAAARQDVLAAEAAYDAAAILVAGETARAWADYCASDRLVSVARNNVEIAGRSLDLTERLYDAGRGLRLDVVQAQSRLETARADLPSFRASRDSAVFRLATLTGRTPVEMQAEIPQCDGVPRLEGPIAVGDAAGLLARRPDVRQAEHALEGAAARVGVATAELYPSVSLGGSIASTALDAGNLGNDDTLTISAGPLISWSFPNIAATRARIRQAEAGADAALARFDQSVLNALQETETALTRYAAERERRNSLEVARDAAAEAARLSRIRYEAGAESFLTVLDSERTFADAQTALARSDATAASAEVDVFIALGGAWPRTRDADSER